MARDDADGNRHDRVRLFRGILEALSTAIILDSPMVGILKLVRWLILRADGWRETEAAGLLPTGVETSQAHF